MRVDQDKVVRKIADLPREKLVALPTPLDSADRLSGQLGVELLIKRDDLFGIGLGGNKLRKLEFILGEAIDTGVEMLITTGGLQSNHARLTAAVAARAGMACELFLKGEPTTSRTGNLLLDELFGASIKFCGVIDHADILMKMAERALELARVDRRALVVPLGGATARGTLGYVTRFQGNIGPIGRRRGARRASNSCTLRRHRVYSGWAGPRRCRMGSSNQFIRSQRKLDQGCANIRNPSVRI